MAGILTIQEAVFQSKIVENPEPLKGKKTVQVLLPLLPLAIDTYPAEEITTIEKARLNLKEKVHQLFWQIDPNILNPLIQISLAMLQPNLRYDQKGNDKKIEEIIQQYPSKVITYKPGDVLVPFLKVLNEKDLLLLAASREVETKDLYGHLPWIIFVICFSMLLYNLLLPKIASPCRRGEPSYSLFFIVLLLTILTSKACLLFTPCPVYIISFAILPLLLVLLQQEKISIIFTTILGPNLHL